jgi:hypothetical protein
LQVWLFATPHRRRSHSRKQPRPILDAHLTAEIVINMEGNPVQKTNVSQIRRRDLTRLFKKRASFQIKAQWRFRGTSKGLPKRCHQSLKEQKLSHFSLLPFPAESGASTIGETAVYVLFIKMGDVTYGFFMPLGATNEACSFRAISCASEPGPACFPRREKESSPMIWSKIIGILERLDNYLSDGVYLHGCYLTGQEKIVRHHRQDEARDHLQDHSDLNRVHVTDVSQSIDGETIDTVTRYSLIPNCQQPVQYAPQLPNLVGSTQRSIADIVGRFFSL